ncbi:PREDICTED: uncharacterized protein LOC109173965 [Ipomoea nil]|uniref:uncharacterized protein LOC109173965 n=1 Tax=Ipomoea nil TaxID=35883 RepID=UPI00090172A1|nr:PREDICTED: uncharacterized protein LOC109173965 [Ipomoea nil]
MLMMGVTDAVMCRAFYSTLAGKVAEWFKSLEPGSITCFASTATKFVRRFATSKAFWKHFMYLDKAKQLEGETLSDFLIKWNTAIGEVEPMDDLIAIHMLHPSLRAGALYQDFILHPPSTYEEAICRVASYASVGEANAAKRLQEVGPSHKSSGRSDNRSTEQSGRGPNRHMEFTPLNRSAVEALKYAQSCNLIRLPEPSRDGHDKSKHCAYHRSKGHDTGKRSTLKQLLEDLLQARKLDRLIEKKDDDRRFAWKRSSKKSDSSTKGKASDHDPPPPSKQVIHVIFG